MGVLYVVAGVGHFVATRVYEGIMPAYLPAHHALVLVSGAVEIAGGVGLLITRTRRATAWGIIALLVCVMPANVWMVQHSELYRGIPVWALWARLPLQGVLVWWAWLYTKKESNVVTSVH